MYYGAQMQHMYWLKEMRKTFTKAKRRLGRFAK